MIDSVIHQIWHPFSAPEMPRDWQRFAQSWRRWHPHHRYVLWGPEESRNFVAQHHPDFLATYDRYPSPIQRIDSVRALLLQHFGGIYVDLDIECFRSVDPLLEGQRLVLAAEPARHSHIWRHKGYQQVLSNAFMATEAGHPFWAALKREFQRSSLNPDPTESTGPFVVSRCWERSPDRLEIKVLSPDHLYPVTSEECLDFSAYDLEHWVRATGRAFGAHHWASTWNRPGQSSRRALRPYHRGIPVRLIHPKMHRQHPGQLLGEGPLVSCIMVTRGWKEPARWSIECFQNQTYQNRELVVATTNPDGDLRAYIDSLDDPRIQFAGVFPSGTPLGGVRNLAVDSARGELICAWDDDDLFGADRLAACVTALLTSGAAAAFLERVAMWWPARRELVLSPRGRWENTILVRRRVMPRYKEIDRGEDSELADQVTADHPIVVVDDPNLFVYVVTGNNTSGLDHFHRFFQRATFAAKEHEYERALTALDKHVPAFEYLGWLERRDPRTFEPLRGAAAAQAESTARAPGDVATRSRLVAARPASLASPDGVPLRFLFAWELGGGLGHTVPLSLIARPLLEAGHEVDLVLHDLSTSRAALGRLADHPRLRLWQAPSWPDPLVGYGDPASYAELLYRAGYLDPTRLSGLVRGWSTLFDAIRPDFLLADHAPTALLAARGRDFGRALVSTGFFDPLPGVPMPTYRDWESVPRERLECSEEVVLGTCNTILAARDQPPLGELQELLALDERFLLTVPELDHFEQRARDGSRVYWGSLPAASHGRPAAWPSGTGAAVFAYLKGSYGPLGQVLSALKASPWRVLAYVPGANAKTISTFSSDKLLIVTDPVDMTEVNQSCDAVVCHAGSGTVMTVLQAGKPLVTLPMHLEQYLVGRRVQSMGAGLVLLEEALESLPVALKRVVEDRSFAEAARAFARRYADMRGNLVAESVAARCHELAVAMRTRRARIGAPARREAEGGEVSRSPVRRLAQHGTESIG